MPPRLVVSKPLHTMTNDEQREITLPKARSARCRREGGRGEVCSAGEVRARFRRDTGEMQARRDCGRACKRDPTEIQAGFTGRVAPAARRGRGEHAVSQPKQPERRGFEWRVPHGHWRTAKICRRKEKGAGSASHQASPTLRHRGTGPAASSGRRLRLSGAAHVDPDPAVGVGPVCERRHEQPPLGAPAVRSERLRRGGEGGRGDERCTEGTQLLFRGGATKQKPGCGLCSGHSASCGAAVPLACKYVFVAAELRQDGVYLHLLSHSRGTPLSHMRLVPSNSGRETSSRAFFNSACRPPRPSASALRRSQILPPQRPPRALSSRA